MINTISFKNDKNHKVHFQECAAAQSPPKVGRGGYNSLDGNTARSYLQDPDAGQDRTEKEQNEIFLRLLVLSTPFEHHIHLSVTNLAVYAPSFGVPHHTRHSEFSQPSCFCFEGSTWT